MTRRSAKTEEIRRHRRIGLTSAKPEDNCYVAIAGTAQLVVDAKKVQDLWDPSYQAPISP